MTTTDPTRTALLAAIAAHPDEDTPRLVYADYLQEQGDDDRAEFIRVQCELGDYPVPLTNMRKIVELRARESALLVANRERWLRVACPRCVNGYEKHPHTGDVIEQWCRLCDRTGAIYAVPRRGFPDTVQGCRLADCVQRVHEYPPGHHADTDWYEVWVPSPWLLRVLAAHPTLTRVPLVGRVPNRYGPDRYYWFTNPAGGTMGEHDLPAALFAALDGGESPGPCMRIYDTADLATDALALAVVAVGRATLDTLRRSRIGERPFGVAADPR